MNADLKEKDFNHDSRIPSSQIKEYNKIMYMHQGTQATNTIYFLVMTNSVFVPVPRDKDILNF